MPRWNSFKNIKVFDICLIGTENQEGKVKKQKEQPSCFDGMCFS